MAYLTGERSQFPGGVDKFNEAYDLTYNQIQAADKLNALRLQRTPLTPAQEQEIMSLTAELRENIITAEDWNKFADAVVNLQQFFNDEVHGYILERQAEWDTYVNDFNHKGVWESGKTYKKQNLVSLPNGNLYIATESHTATTANQPSPVAHTALWRLIGTKGDKGDPGLNSEFKGPWFSSASYNLGDSVSHVSNGLEGGLIYLAKRANTNKPPHTSPDDWQIYTQLSVHRSEPLGAQAGTHFLHVIE